NFVDVIPQRSKLRLTLNMDYDELDDPEGWARDITDIGRWGNGNVDVDFSAPEQIDYIMYLIKQAFDKHTEYALKERPDRYMTQQVSQQINQDEINAILWKACDTFRGTVDPAEYKNYILVMLFLKYISDVWRDHYARYLAETGDEARARRKMRYERFVIPEGCDFYTLYENRNEPDIGERIDKALEAIEEANIEKLEGV